MIVGARRHDSQRGTARVVEWDSRRAAYTQLGGDLDGQETGESAGSSVLGGVDEL